MPSNYHEIELKFEIKNPSVIRQKLKELKAKFIGKAFERAFQLDTKNKDLRKKGVFLRVRTGFKTTLTLKKRLENKRFKEREEIELEISDPGKMRIILENLGFTWFRVMEKYREKWQLGSAEVTIDRLPMSYYVEIEGKEKVIEKIAKNLGFDISNGITKTYWGLWLDYAKENGIKDENIVFKRKR
jgi:predicted adenylyl cyclase CyaB